MSGGSDGAAPPWAAPAATPSGPEAAPNGPTESGDWQAQVAMAMDAVRREAEDGTSRARRRRVLHVVPVLAALACVSVWAWNVDQARRPVAPLPLLAQKADLDAAAALMGLVVDHHRLRTGTLPPDLSSLGAPPMFTYANNGREYAIGVKVGAVVGEYRSALAEPTVPLEARAKEWTR